MEHVDIIPALCFNISLYCNELQDVVYFHDSKFSVRDM